MNKGSIIAVGLLTAASIQATELKTEPKGIKQPAEPNREQIQLMSEEAARKKGSNQVCKADLQPGPPTHLLEAGPG